MHIHRSPGLTAVYNAVRDNQHNHILDLGSSKTGAFNFFSSLSGKIIFECLEDFIEEHHNLSPDNFERALRDYCLPKKPDEKFDIILAWDLLNYLPLENTLKLLNVLRNWCKPDTILFSIKYSGNATPTRPPKFDIKDKHHLTVERFKVEPRHHKAAPIAQFLKHAEDFNIESNISQKQGMLPGFSEQILRFQPDKSSVKQYRSLAEMGGSFAEHDRENCRAHNSPGFNKLILQAGLGARSILDLGRRSPENMEYWRQYFDSVYFEDICSSLQWQRSSHESEAISPNILQFNRQQNFDIIIAWDIFNFCSATQLQALAHRIQAVSHRQTVLHAMLYTGSKIPKRPARFWLKQNNEIDVERVEQSDRNRERLTATGLIKHFIGAKMVGTYAYESDMLGDIREFVFTVDPAKSNTSEETPATPSHLLEAVN